MFPECVINNSGPRPRAPVPTSEAAEWNPSARLGPRRRARCPGAPGQHEPATKVATSGRQKLASRLRLADAFSTKKRPEPRQLPLTARRRRGVPQPPRVRLAPLRHKPQHLRAPCAASSHCPFVRPSEVVKGTIGMARKKYREGTISHRLYSAPEGTQGDIARLC